MISLAHEVPGRIRLVASRARHDPRAAAELRRLARSLPGVTSVTFNPITGSLIVHYDEAGDARGHILAALQVKDRLVASGPRHKALPTWSPENDRLADLVAGVVARHLAERAVAMAITALI